MKRRVILSVFLLTSLAPQIAFSSDKTSVLETTRQGLADLEEAKTKNVKPTKADTPKATVTATTDITDNRDSLVPAVLEAVIATQPAAVTAPLTNNAIKQETDATVQKGNSSNTDADNAGQAITVLPVDGSDNNSSSNTAIVVAQNKNEEEKKVAVDPVTTTTHTDNKQIVAIVAAAAEEKKSSKFEVTITAVKNSLESILTSNKSVDEKVSELQTLKSEQEKMINDITTRLSAQTTKATDQKRKIAEIAEKIKTTSSDIKRIRKEEQKRYTSNTKYKILMATLSDLQKAEITADAALLSISSVAQKTYNQLTKLVDLRNTIAEKRAETKGGKRASSIAKAVFWKAVTLGSGDTTGCDSDDKMNLPAFNLDLFPQVLQQKETSFFNNTPQNILYKKEESIDAEEEKQIAEIKAALKSESGNNVLDQEQLARKKELRNLRKLELKEKNQKETQKDPQQRQIDLQQRAARNLAIRTKQAEVKKTVQKMLVENRLTLKK